MRKKLFFLGVVLILSAAFAVETYSDLASFKVERHANTSVVSSQDALIAFTCDTSVEVIAGKSRGAVATVLTNTLDKPIDVNVDFYDWAGSPSGLSLDVQSDSRVFSLAPGAQKNIWVTVSAYKDTPAGTYYAILRIEADWEGGNAEILTSPCPLTVDVKAPRRAITKTLIYGLPEVLLFTREVWTLHISVDTDFSDDMVIDTIPGEFEVVSYAESKGTTSTTQTGKATHLEWVIGSSGPATLDVTIATKLNPAGKQEFTSPGTYNLNNGACFKSTSICTGPITVVARGD